MLARLETSSAATERALEAARRFTADAGHELRTPLTSIRANLAALRHEAAAPRRRARDALGPAERARVLAELERDLVRLTALLDGLQALARGDAGAVEHAPVDLGDVADAALADARRRHPQRRLRVRRRGRADGRRRRDRPARGARQPARERRPPRCAAGPRERHRHRRASSTTTGPASRPPTASASSSASRAARTPPHRVPGSAWRSSRSRRGCTAAAPTPPIRRSAARGSSSNWPLLTQRTTLPSPDRKAR